MEAAADFEPEPEPWEPEPEPWEPEPEPWEPEPEPEPEQVEMTPQQLAHSFASSAFDGLAQQVGLTTPSRPAGELEPEPDTSEELPLEQLTQQVLVERARLFTAAMVQLCDPASPLGAPIECLATLEKVITNVLANPGEPRVRSLRLGNKLFSRTIAPYPAALECLSALGFESDPSGERLTLSPLDECEPVLEACLAGVQQGIAEARSRGQLTEEEVQEEARASAKRQELEELKRRQCEPAPPLPILSCTSREGGLAVWRRLERKAAAKQKAKREEQAAAEARAAAASAPADSSFAEQMEAARLSRQRSAEEAGRGAEKTPPEITAALEAARKQQRESGASREPHPNPLVHLVCRSIRS